MTGFAYFMRWYLKNLPDLVARYHLDEKGGAVAYDTSKNAINATIFGASPTSGIIDGAFIFDGLNDRCIRPYDTLLDLTDTLTIEAFSSPALLTGFEKGIVARGYLADRVPYILCTAGGQFRFFAYEGDVLFSVSYTPPALNIFYHLAATFDKNLPADNAKLFVSGILRDKATYTSPLPTNNTVLYTGTYGIQYYQGLADEVHLRNRALSPTQIARHSQRRYPL